MFINVCSRYICSCLRGCVIDLLYFTKSRLNLINCIFTRCWRIFHWWVNSHIAWLWKTITFTSLSTLNLRQYLSAKDEKGTTFVYSFAQVPCLIKPCLAINFKCSFSALNLKQYLIAKDGKGTNFVYSFALVSYFNKPWLLISNLLFSSLAL